MLQGIRDRAQGWLAWVIVILISVPFALWGIYEYLGGSPNPTVAEVDGTELTSARFRQAYRRQQTHLQNLLGAGFDLGALNETQMKMAALNELINGEVLLQAGLDEGLRISDEQLAVAIQSRPILQENGRFSEGLYQRWLRMSGLTASGFEQDYRRALLVEQIRRAIADTAIAGTEDTENILRLQGQKRLVDLLNIPVARYEGNKIPEEAIRDYHERNRSEFVTPEQVSVSYLSLSLDDLPDVEEPSEEELRALYEHREANYAEVAGITAPDTGRSFEESRETLLEELRRQQKEQRFFGVAEELANLTFENPDTLVVAADALGLTIRETRFFDRTGAVSGAPQETEDAAKTDTGTQSNPSPDTASSATSSANALIKERRFLAAAFSEDVLSAGNNSEPIELDEYQVVVLRRKARLPSSPQPLEAVRDEIEKRIDRERAQKKIIELGGTLIQKLRAGETPASVAKAHGLAWREGIELGRDDTDEALEIVDRIFRMPRPEGGRIVYDGMPVVLGDYAVIGLRKIIEEKPKDAVARAARATLARTYGNDEYRAYVRALRAGARIEIHEDNL